MASPDKTKIWMKFDHILADYELRSFRAYLINYDEAHSFDNWAMKWKRRLVWVGVIGIGAQAVAFAMTGKLEAYRLGMGISGIVAVGISVLAHALETSPPSLSPFYAERSQKHVEAGSAWLNINKTARVHRLQLRCMPKETFSESQAEVVSKWCTSLSQSYREASQITAIRAETYKKYDSYPLIREKMEMRRKLLQDYLRDTAYSNVDQDETQQAS